MQRLVGDTPDAVKGRKVSEVLEGVGAWHGGIRKRIDENRELLETLMHHAPDLLRERPWVVGWIKSNDDYLLTLNDAAGLPLHGLPGDPFGKAFPRPWPTPEGDPS